MKTILSASVAAMAMTMPVLASDIGLRSAYGVQDNPWSRPYIGIVGGVGSGDLTLSADDSFGNSISGSQTFGGLSGGIRLGYDHVVSENVLIGGRGEINLTNIASRNELSVGGTTIGTVEHTLDWLAVLGARVGMTDRNMLYYAHAGAAVGGVSSTVDGNDIPGLIDNPRLGYSVGIGAEYAIGEHATLVTEYSYTDFAKFDLYNEAGITVSDDLSFHRIATGINFRF